MDKLQSALPPVKPLPYLVMPAGWKMPAFKEAIAFHIDSTYINISFL